MSCYHMLCNNTMVHTRYQILCLKELQLYCCHNNHYISYILEFESLVNSLLILLECAFYDSTTKYCVGNLDCYHIATVLLSVIMYRRMYRSLLSLKYTSATNPLCQQIALGKAFNKKIRCKHTTHVVTQNLYYFN